MKYPEPSMDGFEYQRFYDTGEIPERFFDWETDREVQEFLNNKIDVDELDKRLSEIINAIRFDLDNPRVAC